MERKSKRSINPMSCILIKNPPSKKHDDVKCTITGHPITRCINDLNREIQKSKLTTGGLDVTKFSLTRNLFLSPIRICTRTELVS